MIKDVALIEMLKERMRWGQARQKVLAENVTNANTPKFQPRDVVAPDFTANSSTGAMSAGGFSGVARTNVSHMSLADSGGSLDRRNARSFEVRPSGNGVDLEGEMIKVGDTQADYQMVTTLYQKSLTMLRTASGRR